MMLDLAQNYPPKVKNTNTNHYSGGKTKQTYIYILKTKQ